MKHIFCIVTTIIMVISLLIFTSCKADKKKKPDETVQQLLPDAPAEVTAITLKTVDFEHELVSNGKISARTVAELKFQTSETISQIFVKKMVHEFLRDSASLYLTPTPLIIGWSRQKMR